MLYTTLEKIRAHDPCEGGWRKLLKALGKTKPDNARLSLATILESNGLDDALWCLRAVDNVDWFARRLALDFARSVEHLSTDPRVKACNDVVERFLKKKATKEELDAARAAAVAAGDAAGDAAGAAGDAAWAAARAAAVAAAWAAGTAWAAARAIAAAGDAAWATDAWAAAWAAQTKHFLACLRGWPKGKWPAMKATVTTKLAAE